LTAGSSEYGSGDISVSVNGVSKSYNGITALEDISFQVKRNEIFGLIGPDGAGKTSLLRILATLILPDSGEAHLEGLDVVNRLRAVRRIIGYMPGRFSLYSDLSVRENLDFFAAVFATTVKENYQLIEPIYSHIERFEKRKAGALSGGMKQKLALSCALVHRPRVLLLDEPNTGVDAVSREELWKMLFSLRDQGITILVSTPYMNEAEMCDRVALMQEGSILSIDTPEGVVARYPGKLYRISARDMERLGKDLRSCRFCRTSHRFGSSIHFSPVNDEHMPDGLEEYLSEKGHEDIEIKPIQPSIEDSFIELMGAGTREGGSRER